MRLNPIPPEHLTSEQRELYVKMKAGIDKNLKGFVSERADGALVGPFAPMLHFPHYGNAMWGDTAALSENSTLPKLAHEVAILVVGARFNSRYEVYAHEHVAETAGLSVSKIAAIAAGARPSDLSNDEAIAYDVATKLSSGGQLPESTYQAALEAFGDKATFELVYLIGNYCMISVLLNAYDVSVPERDESAP